jgi:hypothetical protein
MVLFRLRHRKTGLYYSPRSTGRKWNTKGKFLTTQQLGQIPQSIKDQALLQVWHAQFTHEL